MTIGIRSLLGLAATAVGAAYGYPQLGALVGGVVSNSTDSAGNTDSSNVPITGTSLGTYAPMGAAAISGLAGYEGAQATNAQLAANAQQQMNFQATQTSTAYQRAVTDMQAAGLNPMLAYSQGGAQSGSGASAPVENALGAGVSSAIQGAQTIATVKQLSASADNLDTQSDLNGALRIKALADANASSSSAKSIDQGVKNQIAALTGQELANQLAQQTLNAKTQEATASARGTAAEAQRTEYELNAAKNRSTFANTAAGKGQPILDWLGSIIHGATPFIPRR